MVKRKSSKTDQFLNKIIIYILLFMVAVYLIGTYCPSLLLLIPAFPLYKIAIYSKRKENERILKIERLRRTQTIQSILLEFHENPYEFEKYVAELFEYRGYTTELTSKSNDGGIDIVMFKGSNKCIVEVKLYSIGNKIGREKIQKLDSAMRHSNSNYAYFVTTSDFTSNAIEYARECGIRLINGNLLAKMVQDTNKIIASNIN